MVCSHTASEQREGALKLGSSDPESIFLESTPSPPSTRSSFLGIYFEVLCCLKILHHTLWFYFCVIIWWGSIAQSSCWSVQASLCSSNTTSKSQWLTITNISRSCYMSKSLLTWSPLLQPCQKQPIGTQACSSSKAQSTKLLQATVIPDVSPLHKRGRHLSSFWGWFLTAHFLAPKSVSHILEFRSTPHIVSIYHSA